MKKKNFLDNDLAMFFLGPFVFFFITLFTGNRLFYNNYFPNAGENNKRVLLLSGGALFYVVLFFLFMYLSFRAS